LTSHADGFCQPKTGLSACETSVTDFERAKLTKTTAGKRKIPDENAQNADKKREPVKNLAKPAREQDPKTQPNSPPTKPTKRSQ